MFKWNRLSLRSQFLVLFFITQLLVLGVLFFYFNYTEKAFYIEQLVKSLEEEGRLIAASDRVDFNTASLERLDNWIKETGKHIDKRVTVINKDGTVLADSSYNTQEMNDHSDRPEIISILEGGSSGRSIRYSETLNMDMLYFALPFRSRGELLGFIRLSESLEDINLVIKKNTKNYFIFSILFIILSLILVWRFSLDIINPLKRITRIAHNLARGKFKDRVRFIKYQNEIGTLSRAFNFMADQLEHKIKEISEEKSRAEAIVTNTVNGLIATNKYKRVRIINPAARKMLGISAENIKGRELIEVVRQHKIDQFLNSSLDKKEIINEEIVFQQTDKKVFRCSFVPIINDRYEVTGSIIVFNDITELRRLEQVRTEFVANVSHELRTPLTSIIGYLDTILENDIKDSETLNRFLGIIKYEADRLALLIRDLLDLSRMESKGKGILLKPGELGEIIDKTSTILIDKAREKEIDFSLDVEEGLPLVYMIPEQIRQVLVNLIDNAIKYTPEGGNINLRAFSEESRVVVEVQDNGLGISEEDQQRIFERFYRVDKARSRRLGGTGIGLSIVKHIIQNHQSEIEVESEPGEGSIFRFWLKIAK